ncbi:Uncharacterised protein [Vibrio cholerae]|nr:Uncharacterised protein [Vibrio cholerae]
MRNSAHWLALLLTALIRHFCNITATKFELDVINDLRCCTAINMDDDLNGLAGIEHFLLQHRIDFRRANPKTGEGFLDKRHRHLLL